METRQFVMSSNLLYDIIRRQAGTVEKAWLEAVQNSLDAGATKITMHITKEYFEIIDNGEGMSRDQIIKYFEVFGDSQKRGQEEKLGEFGMGRGQIFAQGRVTWTTSDSQMIVDVKNKGLHYDLLQKTRPFSGTIIIVNMYKNIPYLDTKLEKFREWVKYVETPIYLNGDMISQNTLPNATKSDNAIIAVDTSDEYVTVYNRGLFVKKEYRGVGATIISKKNLMVNFARNDIMDECEVYRKILKDLDKLVVKELEKKSTYLNDGCRKEIVRLMKDNPEMIHKFEDKSVFRMANGKYTSLKEIKQHGSFSFFDGKDQGLADHLITRCNRIILSKAPQVMSLLKQFASQESVSIEDYGEIAEKVGYVGSKIIDENSLTSEEKKNLTRIRYMYDMMDCSRKLKVGESKISSAWTDGHSYIVIERRHVKSFSISEVFYILAHEISHDDDTNNTDLHSPEFYEKFHDLTKKKLSIIEVVQI